MGSLFLLVMSVPHFHRENLICDLFCLFSRQSLRCVFFFEAREKERERERQEREREARERKAREKEGHALAGYSVAGDCGFVGRGGGRR